MTDTDGKIERLFAGRNLVYIATVMRDGAPQLSPVWGEMRGGHVLVNTAEGRVKHRNVLRDPRVAVCVADADNPLDMVTMRGRVVKITPDGDYAHADRLTRQYTHHERYPYRRRDEKRIILDILPEKTFVMPEIRPD